MSKYILLSEAKQHLRVDFSDDDTYIQALCDMVEEAVATEIDTDLADLEDEESETIPLRLKQAMLLMIGHYYLLREPVTVGVTAVKIPYGFDFLIAPYVNYNFS